MGANQNAAPTSLLPTRPRCLERLCGVGGRGGGTITLIITITPTITLTITLIITITLTITITHLRAQPVTASCSLSMLCCA